MSWLMPISFKLNAVLLAHIKFLATENTRSEEALLAGVTKTIQLNL